MYLVSKSWDYSLKYNIGGFNRGGRISLLAKEASCAKKEKIFTTYKRCNHFYKGFTPG